MVVISIRDFGSTDRRDLFFSLIGNESILSDAIYVVFLECYRTSTYRKSLVFTLDIVSVVDMDRCSRFGSRERIISLESSTTEDIICILCNYASSTIYLEESIVVVVGIGFITLGLDISIVIIGNTT